MSKRLVILTDDEIGALLDLLEGIEGIDERYAPADEELSAMQKLKEARLK